MVIVLALAFLLSAIVTIYTLFRSGDTQVPNIVGHSEAEAQKLAEQAGLRVKIQRRNDPAIAPNSVIETRPGPNSSVKKNSVLTIVVSSGPIQNKSQLVPANSNSRVESTTTQNKDQPVTKGPSSPGRRHQIRTIVVATAKSLINAAQRVVE
jgi:serine/threonine-protein kinase